MILCNKVHVTLLQRNKFFFRIPNVYQNNDSIHLHSPSPKFILHQLPNLVQIAKRKHESIVVDIIFLGHLGFSWDIFCVSWDITDVLSDIFSVLSDITANINSRL